MRLVYHILLAFVPIALSQRSDGDSCVSNTGAQGCTSEYCDLTQPLNSDPGTCIARPSGYGTPCSKGKEAEQCDTGFCDQGSLTCAYQQRGGPCDPNSGVQQCYSWDLCDVPVGASDAICLEANLASGADCKADSQCPGKEKCIESICQAETSGPTPPFDDGVDCKDASECKSGICEDHIANDGFQKVCLASNVAENGDCDVDQQCQGGFKCTDFTCQKEGTGTGTGTGTDTGTGTGTGTDTGTGTGTGSGSEPDTGNQGDEVVTTTIVQNGATQTVVQTRTVGGAAGLASARASASRVSTSARASTSARSGADKVLTGTSAWGVVAVAIVFGAIIL